ncbi:hypothetical protein HGT71_15535 [Rosenbergiella epipactidis]|uniref:hypothetical protein n=1 Tax=Rosenbergiella epipactidis TaxID=1544694 RepID=UPI001BDAC62C|nr:hypothetical protein [Rosenbergiella epipactidis]MBT0719655.1 hypothetical protein [Rosenbergiella epipactidis]
MLEHLKKGLPKMTESKKEMFIKKTIEQDQEKAEAIANNTRNIDNYRKGMFDLGKQITSWLDGTSVSIKNLDRDFEDASAQKVYRINTIELKRGNNIINIIPTACFNIAPRNFSAEILLNGKNKLGNIFMNENFTWDLIDIESTYPNSKKITYSTLDEDLFFDVIEPLAQA